MLENQRTVERSLVVRLKGGLGNQLFEYAAARRLALVNKAELVLDDVTGFARDFMYRRQYLLHLFPISGRLATPSERLEPFARGRRAFAKWRARRAPFGQRKYVVQERQGFDERILQLRFTGRLYLDGHWQSEKYFKDIETTIRNELRFDPPLDAQSQAIAEKIQAAKSSVALHARWFASPGQEENCNAGPAYYERAINYIRQRLDSPTIFLFSDNPEAARSKLELSEDHLVTVSHQATLDGAYEHLWLMSLCQHFIIANSTYSWWGAWLGSSERKIVISPAMSLVGVGAWGFEGLIPREWVSM